jgi:hypothetical protein
VTDRASPLRLGLAAAIAGITLLAVVTGRRDSTLLFIVTAYWLVAFTALGVSVVNRRRLSGLVDRVKGAAPVAVGGLVEAPPAKLTPLVTAIRSLGFDVAGATDTMLDPPPIRTWILVERSGDTWVEAGVAGGPIAVFVSDAAQGRFIETAHPTGEAIDDPRLLSQVVSTSAADALTAHRAAVAGAGGPVRGVRTIDEYLAAEALHRERTGGMRIRNYLDRVNRPAVRDWAIGSVVALVCMGALLFLPLQDA